MRDKAIQAAITAMNTPTWTGLTPIDLVKAGRITDFEKAATDLLAMHEGGFGGETALEIIRDNAAFIKHCVGIMELNK